MSEPNRRFPSLCVVRRHQRQRAGAGRLLCALALLAAGVVRADAPDYPVGNQRIQNVSSDVTDHVAPALAATFELTTVAGDLEFLTAHELLPDGRLVIAEKSGRVLLRSPDGRISLAGQLPVEDQGARGLLNVVAHPNFAKNRELIVYYSVKDAPESDKQRVSAFKLRADGKLDLRSERVIVRGLRGASGFEQGGGLAFDRHQNLYVGVGDGGCRAGKSPEPPYTPTNYFATCLSNANGKILRVRLDGSIPQDNPLVRVDKVTACGEQCGDDPFTRELVAPRRDIWAWGVRNPWRMWIDPKTDKLWLVDDGDITHEEVDVVPPAGGVHLGWPWREGAAGHARSVCRKVVPNAGDCTDPAYFCKHGASSGDIDGGCQSMGGGLAVDDARWPAPARGRYYFGDCSNGYIWSLDLSAARDAIVPRSRRDFARVRGLIVDMDAAHDGGLYVGVLELPPARSRIVRISPKSVASSPERRTR